MINRDNWKLTTNYLDYVANVHRRDPLTVQQHKSNLRHLLEWADDRPFSSAPAIRPVFPEYVEQLGIAHSTQVRVLTVARSFFTWFKLAEHRKAAKISALWIETLSPKTQAVDMVKDHVAYTVDEIRQLLRVEPETLTIRRTQAAAAFLFLSGMRAGAFTTMPISSVDLANQTIRQWPEMGVHTKNSKRATTYFLDIPDLMTSVKEWDSLLRVRHLPCDTLWYTPLTTDGMDFLKDHQPSANRNHKLVEALRRLCDLAGVVYKSPHKLRHGHAVYALSRCQNIADLKAVSQNLMHSDISTTDGIYGILPGANVQARIAGLR